MVAPPSQLDCLPAGLPAGLPDCLPYGLARDGLADGLSVGKAAEDADVRAAQEARAVQVRAIRRNQTRLAPRRTPPQGISHLRVDYP